MLKKYSNYLFMVGVKFESKLSNCFINAVSQVLLKFMHINLICRGVIYERITGFD